MPLAGRLLTAAPLVVVTAFCIVRAIAGHDPTAFDPLRVGYAVVGIGCLAAVVMLVGADESNRRAAPGRWRSARRILTEP